MRALSGRQHIQVIYECNFSAKVQEVYGIPIFMRYVRMSWATDLYASNPTQTKVKEITFKMSHSPVESALYKKILIIIKKDFYLRI